jgi:hypothetical protein
MGVVRPYPVVFPSEEDPIRNYSFHRAGAVRRLADSAFMPASASRHATAFGWSGWHDMPADLRWPRSDCRYCPTAGFCIGSSAAGATERRM